MANGIMSSFTRSSVATLAVLAAALWTGMAPAALDDGTSDGMRVDDVKIDVAVAGVVVGRMALAARSDGRSYGTSAIIVDTGLASWFTDFRYEASVSGWIRGEGFEPVAYSERIDSSGDIEETSMRYEKGTPAEIEMSFPEPDAADPAEQGGTLDPLTAFYILTRDAPDEELCGVSFHMFDGSRRSRVDLGTPQPDDRKLVCEAEYERIEGWTEEEMEEQSVFPFEVSYSPLDGRPGWFRLSELTAPTSFGRLRARRTN